MQMWLNFALMVALALMVGVSISVNQSAQEQALRHAYLETHPEVDETIAEALLDGTLTAGMAPDQVLLVWGPPVSVKVMEWRPDVEMWAYPRAMVLFERGGLRDWATSKSEYDSGDDFVRRFSYVLANDALDDRMATMIRKGQITPGMTPEQVEASWGTPAEVLPIYSDTLGETTVWVFSRGRNGQVTVTFQEGEVLSWADIPKLQSSESAHGE